jgi:predicted porin
MERQMKKTLIALAIAGSFAGVAQAQSSVTLYGIADVNLQMTDPKPGNVKSTIGVNSGHQSVSRWGLRGSEDLGGGMSAIFTLESGFNIDNGTSAQGGRLFGRQAFAGLRGGFGTLVMGRVATFGSGTGSFDMFGSVDPFGTGFGDSSLGSTFSSAGALRVNNAVLYQTPSTGGFQFGLLHSFQAIADAEVPNRSANAHLTGLGANFSFGPIWTSLTYELVNNPAAGASDQKHLQFGVKATFGPATFSSAVADEKDQFAASAVGVTNGADARAYMVGTSLKVGPAGTLLASFQRRNAQKIGTTEAERKVWALGYSHSLSRRSNLYFNFSDSDGEKSLNNNAAFDRRQITAGMRHSF